MLRVVLLRLKLLSESLTLLHHLQSFLEEVVGCLLLCKLAAFELGLLKGLQLDCPFRRAEPALLLLLDRSFLGAESLQPHVLAGAIPALIVFGAVANLNHGTRFLQLVVRRHLDGLLRLAG